jgi:hypothetical protein
MAMNRTLGLSADKPPDRAGFANAVPDAAQTPAAPAPNSRKNSRRRMVAALSSEK